MRLLLLRHAKSDWADTTRADIDRELNRRGKSAARLMGGYLQQNALLPDRTLCSTALRTRETLSRLLPFLPNEAQIHLVSDIYDQGDLSYTGILRKFGGRSQTLMILGHNPATEQTAEELVGTGDQYLRADMNAKYPTAALAVIDFDISDWADLRAGTGHLDRFVKPRDLDEGTSPISAE
ncbi:MAG: histidine phosphatase family protein [Roseibium sp.]